MTAKLTRKSLILVITASFVLSACGIKGELKTPPPVWGETKPDTTQPTTP